MPEWVERLLIAGGGLTMLAGMVKAWWEDRIRREALQQAIVDRLQKKNDALQTRFESLLMDAKAKAEEDHAQRAEAIATNKQLAAVTTAMIAALDRAIAINARFTKDGT
jgi:vacuolar-type H+-ATPase subunit D/Vma8